MCVSHPHGTSAAHHTVTQDALLSLSVSSPPEDPWAGDYTRQHGHHLWVFGADPEQWNPRGPALALGDWSSGITWSEKLNVTWMYQNYQQRAALWYFSPDESELAYRQGVAIRGRGGRIAAYVQDWASCVGEKSFS